MDVIRRIIGGFISGSSGGTLETIDTDNYLTIYALEDGLTASLSTNACEYCIDGDGNWLSLSASATTQSINTGHRLSFRGNLTPNSSNGIGTFTISKRCNLEGNCMSMLFGDNAANNLSLAGKDDAFYMLFENCTNIVSVSENFLPATTLTQYCYCNMFYDCTSLTTAPELPATTLANGCYVLMFSGCTGLTSAPELPATTLTQYCYSSMFHGCTSLTISPELPATTLADYCCQNMFSGCTGLTSAHELPATTLARWCYHGMFNNCTSLTTAPELPATTLASNCYSYMFYGCTSLTTAPALPATTLADYCYQYMFYGCNKLNYIKMLGSNIGLHSLLEWVYGVSSTGTFVKNPEMTKLSTGVGGIPSGWTVVDDSSGSPATDNYLTIYALEDGLTASLSTNACEYCVDGDGNWKSLAAGTATESINAGHRLSFRGNLTPKNSTGIGTFTISKKCNLEGNCMSILFGNNAANSTSLSGKSYAFYYLFKNCANIVSVSENFLPATTLANYCYNYMFYNCSSLTTAPELPATTLTSGCYQNMFNGCSNLTTAPALPATTLTDFCYYGMFDGCTSLTTAPALPATTLAKYCYDRMFHGCTSLTTAPSSLPATTLATNCYYGMFDGCTSLITAPALPATTLAYYCYNCMFYGCTSLTTAPELPATTLADNCYGSMFNGCYSLTSAPELPATTLADNCYGSMFRGCASLTSAPALPATTLANNCYNQMFYNCTKLNYIKMLATDILLAGCLTDWVVDVGSTGTFVKNINMTSLPTGVNGIPSGWTVKDDYTPTTCTSLTITADDVSGRDTTTTIYYTAVTNGKDSNGNIMNNVTITGTATSASFAQNTSTTNTVQRTISYTYLGKTATTTITQGVWVAAQYIIDLNNQWQKSTTVSNPDTSEYDGVYESFSNYNIASTAAIMKITIDGYSSFKFYIRSYAESSCDYVMVSQLDQTINNSTSYSNTTLVKAHTSGKQQSGTALSNYTPVEFTNIDGGKHVITIVYRKDGSVNSGTDRGYVLLPKMAGDSSGSGGDSGGSGDINNYLTIVALEDNLTVTYTTATYESNHCEYCVDGDGNWLSLKSGSTTQSVNTGHTLSFKNTVSKTHMQGYTPGVGTFSISKKCNLEGNCMSMVFGDNGSNTTSLVGRDYAFYKLFSDCTNIIEVSDNLLPATTLGTACYSYMFNNCSNLTKAPCLPATTTNCLNYKYMFYGCSSMITPPPSLPATIIGTEEYYGMFYNCSSLTISPLIMVKTFNYNYYDIGNNLQSMFYGCSNLNKIYLLTASIPSETKSYAVFSSWVNGVASTGTFIKSSSLTDLTYLPTGNSGIPSGWTVINHLITFTINGTEYQVEEGMTWEEFINSEYNISGHFTSAYGSAVKYKGNMIYRSIEGGIQSVSVIDLIVKNGMYVY